MAKQKLDLRIKIIETTIQLMKEHGDTSLITMRDIASRVGVGVGLINYHFQTKENLINICSLEMIGSAINQLQSMSQDAGMKPAEKLFQISKGIAEFMVSNDGISKISITSDFTDPRENDNTAQLSRMLLPLVKEICAQDQSEKESLILLHIFISTIEAAFLRNEVLMINTGFSFTEAEQREDFIHFCIKKVFNQ